MGLVVVTDANTLKIGACNGARGLFEVNRDVDRRDMGIN